MRSPLFFLLLLITQRSFAQEVQVLLPQKTVIAGAAFQVQYIITDPQAIASVSNPSFEPLQLVSGPARYKGNTVVNGVQQPILNLAYTIIAPEAGTHPIPVLEIKRTDGVGVRSKAMKIVVQPRPRASFSVQSSFTDARLYAPASQSAFEKLLEENLFIRVEVDKKSCYVGEPVVASFTLYSRLQSSSQADRSPAFYGFSVMDMLDTREAHQSVKVLQGKIYNTSVLRKVQLYPVQSGQLTIDEMYVHNEVEFLDTMQRKTVTLQKEIITAPVRIDVKPFPEPQPAHFTGAVGVFTMQASLPQEKIARGSTGRLLVALRGAGNFMQFSAPFITWPPSVESFEPRVVEKTNRETAPASGEKRYEFLFTATSEGNHQLPPVRFSFFNPRTERYEVLTSDSFLLEVTPPLPQKAVNTNGGSGVSYWWLTALIPVGLLLFLLTRRKRRLPAATVQGPARRDYAAALRQLSTASIPDAAFYNQLHALLLEYEKENHDAKEAINSILRDCQQLAYAGAQGAHDRNALIERALRIVSQNYSAYL